MTGRPRGSRKDTRLGGCFVGERDDRRWFDCERAMANFGRPVKPANTRTVHFSMQPSIEPVKPPLNIGDDAAGAVEDRSWRESSFDLRQGLVTEEHTIPGELLDELFRLKR